MRPSWGHLGASWGLLGASWGLLGASGGQNEARILVKPMILASSPRPFWTLQRVAEPPVQVQGRG
eukprot:2431137-Pyramimonas_sp.AAC.1